MNVMASQASPSTKNDTVQRRRFQLVRYSKSPASQAQNQAPWPFTDPALSLTVARLADRRSQRNSAEIRRRLRTAAVNGDGSSLGAGAWFATRKMSRQFGSQWASGGQTISGSHINGTSSQCDVKEATVHELIELRSLFSMKLACTAADPKRQFSSRIKQFVGTRSLSLHHPSPQHECSEFCTQSAFKVIQHCNHLAQTVHAASTAMPRAKG